MAQPIHRQVGGARSIVVVFDAGAPCQAALEAAALLAADQEAELLALFIEDLDLIHVAGLPFAREIGIASAAQRALDAIAMQRALRASAEEARRTVERIARRLPLRWSFQITRDVLGAEALAVAAAADLIIEALRGSARAASQIAEITRASERVRVLRARTRQELDALKREVQLANRTP